MIDELPGQAILGLEVGTEGFDAEGFGGVVAGVEEVDVGFFGGGVAPVGAFAGDEGVDSGGGGFEDAGSGSAGNDGDVFCHWRASGGQVDSAIHGVLEGFPEFFSFDFVHDAEADGLAVAF